MDDMGLWGLFISGFISSTLMPGGSEVLLGYLLTQPEYKPVELWLAASAGNTLGGVVTFAMGWWVGIRWPVRQPDKINQQRALVLIKQYGAVVLLFSWLPVVGDPLCFVAGWLRCNPLGSLIFVLIGKALRYLIIVLLIN